jgi:hypothetical protein
MTGVRRVATSAPCRLLLIRLFQHGTLYVTAGGGRTMRYDVLPDDTVANGRLFVAHGLDGMRVDQRGNLYDKRRRTWRDPNHVAGGKAARAAAPAAAGERTARQNLRHERGLRGRRQSWALHHCLHPPLQDPIEPARRTAWTTVGSLSALGARRAPAVDRADQCDSSAPSRREGATQHSREQPG